MHINYPHVAQQYFLLCFTKYVVKYSRLAWLLLLAKEAENANSHNSVLVWLLCCPVVMLLLSCCGCCVVSVVVWLLLSCHFIVDCCVLLLLICCWVVGLLFWLICCCNMCMSRIPFFAYTVLSRYGRGSIMLNCS